MRYPGQYSLELHITLYNPLTAVKVGFPSARLIRTEESVVDTAVSDSYEKCWAFQRVLRQFIYFIQISLRNHPCFVNHLALNSTRLFCGMSITLISLVGNGALPGHVGRSHLDQYFDGSKCCCTLSTYAIVAKKTHFWVSYSEPSPCPLASFYYFQ